MTRYVSTLSIEALYVLSLDDLDVLRIFDLGSGPTLFHAARSVGWLLGSNQSIECLVAGAGTAHIVQQSTSSRLLAHAEAKSESS